MRPKNKRSYPWIRYTVKHCIGQAYIVYSYHSRKKRNRLSIDVDPPWCGAGAGMFAGSGGRGLGIQAVFHLCVRQQTGCNKTPTDRHPELRLSRVQRKQSNQPS